MKNTFKFIIITIVVALLQVGCSEKFLEQSKLDSMSEDVLFKTEADGIAAVNGVYDLLHNDHIDYVIKGIWYNANFLSQDVHNWGADVFYTTYEIPVTFASCNTFWKVNYIGVARANMVIEKLKKMQADGILTQDMGNRLIGECLFLRGFFYTQLASNFGEVPLILVPSVDGRESQATQNEVFTQVAADMAQAAEYLPWSYDNNNIGRATKGAALAYAGEAYLWIKDYVKAETALQQVRDYAVANPSVIGLEANYWDIHELTNENGKEALFSIQYITPEARDWNRGDDCQWLQNFTMPDEVNGTGYAYADKKLYDAFETGDTRKIASIIGPGDEHPTCPINSYPKIKNAKYNTHYYHMKLTNTCGADSSYTYVDTVSKTPLELKTVTVSEIWDKVGRSGYYVNKFWRQPASVIDGSEGPMFSELNLIMLRYGQVVLDLAEAKWRNNKAGEATALIQEIRNRAWAGTAPAPAADLEAALIHEYRCEVAGEFSFWFILRRMGVAVKWVKDTYDITVPPGRDVIPIPQTQLDLNRNLHQTSGYLTN